jgi:gamma-glutamyltranspeptidase/glutathione hydrolase
LHAIIPAFMTRDGRPEMAFGLMGGNLQAQGHAQTVLRHVVEGLDPQASCNAPRWRIDDAEVLTLEAATPAAVVQGLDFGSAQIIVRLPADPEQGGGGDVPRCAGGSDPRRDGQAIGC